LLRLFSLPYSRTRLWLLSENYSWYLIKSTTFQAGETKKIFNRNLLMSVILDCSLLLIYFGIICS
jgi:hypothetical protein